MMPATPHASEIVILGGGPAGLTAARELTKFGRRPTVLEKGDKVGGLARTENYKGFHFDMGGHRFFTKAEDVKKVWREVLGDHLLRRPRLSRIYYNRRFFHYPLKPLNALFGLGLRQAMLIVLSYLRWQIAPSPREDTFEQWATNRFGRRLFAIFFKTYTEKVWGIPCSELRAEWAAQRIKDLSLKSAVLNMFLKPKVTIKTLIEAFDYPELGPGMMWNAVKAEIERGGGDVHLNSDVISIRRTGPRIDAVVVAQGGREKTIRGAHFISSIPVTEFIQRLSPPPPAEVLMAATQLVYRDFLTVCLIVNKAALFPDNWIYVHSPEVKVGRVQNFKNWSPHMVPDPRKTSLGLEYFCTEGDVLWSMSDADLIELGKAEMERIGLANAGDVEDGCVFRVPKAYPVYDATYAEHLATVRAFVDGLANCQTIGRNGLHRYNNQDHAMMTGLLAVRNLVVDERHDLWSVNTDQEYHEEQIAGEVTEAVDAAVSRILLKLDRGAFGGALGTVAGLGLFVVTLALVLQGGAEVGPNLALLAQYLPGFSVSVSGAVVGLLYGFLGGFGIGWSVAVLRNIGFWLYFAGLRRQSELRILRRFLEFV